MVFFSARCPIIFATFPFASNCNYLTLSLHTVGEWFFNGSVAIGAVIPPVSSNSLSVAFWFRTKKLDGTMFSISMKNPDQSFSTIIKLMVNGELVVNTVLTQYCFYLGAGDANVSFFCMKKN